MKKAGLFLVPVFVLASAIPLSLGLECFLNLLGLFCSVNLSDKTVIEQFPRFIPFCAVVGFFALIAFACVLTVNIKAYKKFKFNKVVWCVQYMLIIVLTFPLVNLWMDFFDFLQITF